MSEETSIARSGPTKSVFSTFTRHREIRKLKQPGYAVPSIIVIILAKGVVMNIYELTFVLPEINDAAVDAIYGRCPDNSIGKSHGRM